MEQRTYETVKVEREGGIAFDWIYNRDLFDRWRMEQMVRHFAAVLAAATAAPRQRLDQLDLLSAAERPEVIAGFM